jgi:D-aspartate ligase
VNSSTKNDSTELQRQAENRSDTSPLTVDLFLATGQYPALPKSYTFTPQTTHLPGVAIFDNGYAPTLAFLQSLGSKGVPIHVYGSDRWSPSRWSRYCAKFERCPPVDCYNEFLPWLKDKVRAGLITRVAPTSDLISYYLAILRQEFSIGVRRSIPRLTEIENCLIKSRFQEICQGQGLPVPESYSPNSIEEAIDCASRVEYPVVLKPKSHLVVGMAERGRLIASANELRSAFQAYPVMPGHEPLAERYPELRWPMLQKYVPSSRSRVFSVSGIKDINTGMAADSVSYKREQWPPNVGTSMVQVSCESQAVLRAGLRVVDKLLSRGIFEIELLAEGNEYLAIDLNPRGFGFMTLDIERGNDLAWLWLQSTLMPISRGDCFNTSAHVECRVALPYYLIRLFAVLRGPHRRKKLAQFWRDMRRPTISMTGYWRDPIPMLLSRLSILKHPRHLLRTCWKAAARRAP